MKHARKLASLLLALVMVFALATTAFADGEATTKYQIFQIFTGDYSNGLLTNVKWGKNGTDTEGSAVADTIITELEGVAQTASDTDKLAVITTYANLNSTPFRTGDDTKYDNLPDGYYLVRNTPGTQNGENQFYTLYVVQVVNNTLEFAPKGDLPVPEKKIVEGDSKVDVNEASIGDTISYEITGTMPSNLGDYKTYYYMFTDTLSKGLTYKNDVKVTIGGVDVTKYFYKGASRNESTGVTTLEIGIQNILALNNVNGVTVTKDSEIAVTYSATLNEDAVIAGEGNPNDVKLDYSNDPNNSGEGTTTPPPENPDKPKPTHPTGETPRDEVTTYTTELTILKNDENKKILPGAEFTLTGNGVNIVLVSSETFEVSENGEYWKLKNGTYTRTAPTIADDETDNSADYDDTTTKYAKTTSLVAKGTDKTKTDVTGTVSPETGTVTFSGLGAGTYTITETKTPAGYNTIAPITFTLTFNASTKAFASDNASVVVGTDNKLDTTIVNQSGATLPSTGGIGTTIFYVLGSILVIGAVVLLVTKKRMDTAE